MHIDVASGERDRAVRVALERHLDEIDTGCFGEGAGKDLRRGTGDHADFQPLRTLARLPDELAQRFPSRGLVHRDRRWVDIDDGEELVVLGHDRRRHGVLRGDEGSGEEAQGVTVGLRLAHLLGAEHAARPGLVDDDDGVAQRPAQLLGDEPADEIGTSARRERHDERNRLAWIRLCECRGQTASEDEPQDGPERFHWMALARRMLAIIEDFIRISLASAGVCAARRYSSRRRRRTAGSRSSSVRLLRTEASCTYSMLAVRRWRT